jgi:hypothetical protein
MLRKARKSGIATTDILTNGFNHWTAKSSTRF